MLGWLIWIVIFHSVFLLYYQTKNCCTIYANGYTGIAYSYVNMVRSILILVTCCNLNFCFSTSFTVEDTKVEGTG